MGSDKRRKIGINRLWLDSGFIQEILQKGEEVKLKMFLEMAYPSSWNKKIFEALGSYSKRSQYCRQHLTRIVSGSGREVFKIDEEKALKLAYNIKGQAQNEQECSLSNDYMAPESLMAKVFECEKDSKWLEMELCRPATSKDFRDKFKIDYKNFSDILWYVGSEGKNKSDWAKEMLASFNEKDHWWFYELEQFIGDFGYPIGDLTRKNSWGVTKDGRLVIVDYGLSSDVYSTHYQRKR